MEISQIRYFITLCQTLNFTLAAKQCNVTQPAFTRSIQRLEQEFGGALIFRERNHSQLTELGQAVRPHLETMLNAADEARQLANAKHSRLPAILKIGLGPGIGATYIAGALRETTKMSPELSIHFEESPPEVLIDAMLKNILDCALVPEHYDLPERFKRYVLYTDRAVAVLSSDHRLLSKRTISGRDLLDERILVSERCGDFATRLATITSYSLRFQRFNGTTSQMYDLIVGGLGIALLSDRLPIFSSLQTRPFHAPDLTRRVILTTVAGRPLNPAAARFVELCCRQTFV